MAVAQLGPSGRVIARIQRLCTLGLGSQAVVPPLMRELSGLIPSHGSTFFWAGPKLELANMYCDRPMFADLTPLYLGEFHNRREREVMLSFTECMRNSYPSPAGPMLERVLKVEHRAFVKSDMYNLILRPLKWERILQLKISDRHRHLAALHFGRPDNTADFARRDSRLLEAIAPFIAHALTDRREEGACVESDDTAIVVADSFGRVLHRSWRAGQLLLMARFPSLSPQIAAQIRGHRLPDPVVHLCKMIVAHGEDGVLSSPPVWRHRNPWGEFVFRAYAIDPDTGGSGDRLVGVSIEYCEPLQLKLSRRIEELPLSRREAQLCLALVAGRKRAEIAESMGISEHTAITHCRSLYAKVGIHTRAELTEKLRLM